MSEFNIRAESVDVEQIMSQIRSRIREKRGTDYTETQIREMAAVKLERFLDPKNVRSDLTEHYRRVRGGEDQTVAPIRREPPPPLASFEWDPDIIYRSSRGLAGRMLQGIRRLLNPVLKLFFNPTPIVHALNVQREINEHYTEQIDYMVETHIELMDRFEQIATKLAARAELDALTYELLNNLVVEMTRLSIDMKNHRMRVESVAGRLDFDERRARSLEGVVQYRARTEPAAAPPTTTDTRDTPDAPDTPGGPERKRRRRRRGRRRPESGDVAAGAAGRAPHAAVAAGEDAEPIATETPAAAPPEIESDDATAVTVEQTPTSTSVTPEPTVPTLEPTATAVAPMPTVAEPTPTAVEPTPTASAPTEAAAAANERRPTPTATTPDVPRDDRTGGDAPSDTPPADDPPTSEP